MKESVVSIGGHQYRYGYDPGTKSTEYLGPVGDAPELSERIFHLILVGGIVSDDTGHFINRNHREYSLKRGVWLLDQDELDEIRDSLEEGTYERSVWDSLLSGHNIRTEGDYVAFIETPDISRIQMDVINIVSEWRGGVAGGKGQPIVFEKDRFRELMKKAPDDSVPEMERLLSESRGNHVVLAEEEGLITHVNNIVMD